MGRLFTRGIFGWSPPAGVIGAYAIVTLGAGHGALPAGLMLVFGAQELLSGRVLGPWLLTLLFTGWFGIAALGLMLVPTIALRARWLLLLGLVSLFTSVAVIVTNSEALPFTLLTALPFVVFSVLMLLRAARRPEAGPPAISGSAS